MMHGDSKYLFVDLDGTFALNDLFQERIVKLFFQVPLRVIEVFVRRGLVGVKHLAFENYEFNKIQILVNRQVLKLIEQKKSAGYIVCLATASPQVYADYILKIWSVFDYAYGSDCCVNLKSHAKLDLIMRLSEQVDFEYVGDSLADEVIFKKCSRYYKIIDKKVYEFIN
jgi:phosphoserine phosphatase